MYTEEPLDFSIKTGDKEGAMSIIAKIYSSENNDTHKAIYEDKILAFNK